jgi:DNA-directed RNA polymerase subunit M/transcription elongation factor TFIIS
MSEVKYVEIGVKTMKCSDCGSTKVIKWGTRPLVRKNMPKKRVQAYLCTNCYHQWKQKH